MAAVQHFPNTTIPVSVLYPVDVPDNSTSSNELHRKFSVMSDAYHREDNRLKTFQKWPIPFIDSRILAATGMFYTGQGDKVKCYFCEVEIGQWETGDHPVLEHNKWSPNCPLLRHRATNNIPNNAEELERLLPEISYDICGVNSELFRTNAQDISLSSPSNFNEQLNNGSNNNNPVSCTPDFPEYAIETARLRSYVDWPSHMKQKPAQLAEAGFFYTGKDDRVVCFSCGGGLKDWDVNDDPWEQHALWLRKCHYLKLIKGQSFIDEVVEKLSKAGAADEVTNNAASQQTNSSTSTTNETSSTSVSAAAVSSFMQPCGSKSLASCMPMAPIIAAATAFIPTPIAVESIHNDNVAEAVRPASLNLAPEDKEANVSAAPSSSDNEKKPPTPGIQEEKLCKICYAAEYNTAFLPCGHVVACAKCASSVTKCPLCRKVFTNVMRVYFS